MELINAMKHMNHYPVSNKWAYDAIIRWMLSGKAYFMIANTTTSAKMGFRIHRKMGNENTPVFFVSVDTEVPRYDNDIRRTMTRHKYLCMLSSWDLYKVPKWTRGSQFDPNGNELKVFQWLWSSLWNSIKFPDYVVIYHRGRCGKCAHKLSDQRSMISGYGPSCIKDVMDMPDDEYLTRLSGPQQNLLAERR